MSQLIPFDPQAAADLEERFAASKFRSTDFFIDFYNSGLVNKAADEVVDLAQAVDATFKNVKLQGKNLVFISRTEVELGEVLTELRKWDILVKVKDRLAALVAEGAVTDATVVEFPEDSVGVLYSVEPAQEGADIRTRLLDEKFFRPADEALVQAIHEERSSVESPRLQFRVGDFTDLDDSFISTVYTTVFGA